MKYRYQSGETVYEVLLEGHGDGYRVTINGERYEVEVLDAGGGSFTLRLGGGETLAPRVVYWGADGEAKWLSSGGCAYRLERPRERRRGGAVGGSGDNALRAPMPAQVRAVQVGEGDEVAAGQTLLLLEAMKMEIKLSSPRAGKVARILVKQGQTVEREQILVELE
jgi:acetyl/propionyl-CoA carboxylase alpha subunit